MTTPTTPTAPPALPFIRDQRWVSDAAVAAVVTVISVLTARSEGRDAEVSAFLLASSLLVRRSHPRLALAWALVASLLQVYYLPAPTVSIVVVPMIVYAVTRYASPAVGLATVWLGLAGAVLGPARWTGLADGNWVGFAVTCTACAAIVAGAYLLGRQLREQGLAREQRNQAEAERRRLQESEQEQRARAVAVDERSRIARELHDIVAHSLSVIVVQAEGGRAVVLTKPEVGAQVLDTIAETGRGSLAEMRRIVDLLRGGDPQVTSFLPSPGLTDIAELVERSGDRFSLTVTGPVPSVPPAVGLTAYRVVQESITNVLKHAGPGARARVAISYLPSMIEIEVVDDGRGAAATASAPTVVGHGLRGMDERLALQHGTLSARPRPGGGFAVHATIPIQPAHHRQPASPTRSSS